MIDNEHPVDRPINQRAVRAVVAVLLLAGTSLAGEAPMVGFLYSRHRGGAGTGYDETFANLRWPHHKWENVRVRQLSANLDRYDLLLCQMVYNLAEAQDFKPYRSRWRSFLDGGGVIVVAGPQDNPLQWDWIVDLGTDFHFELRTFRSFQKSSDWTNPEAELNFGRVDARWAHFDRWSDKWTVTNRDAHGKPIVLYQKVGKGLLVVSTSYGGDGFARADDLSKIWNLAERSRVKGPFQIKRLSWGKGNLGNNTVGLTVQNASGSAATFQAELWNFNEGLDVSAESEKIVLEGGQEADLSLGCTLGDGANELSLVLRSGTEDGVTVRTGGRFDLINLRVALKILDQRIEEAGSVLAELGELPKQSLGILRKEHGELAARSVDLKAESKAGKADRRACHDRIVAAAERAKLLAAQVKTWRQPGLVPGPGRRFVVSKSQSRQRVFRDRPWISPGATELHLELAANEYESIEVVIVPLPGGLQDVRVSCSELKSPHGSIRDIQVRPVADLYVPPSGWYPDVLLSWRSFDVPADCVARGVWITVHAPPDTPAGMYSGTVTVDAADCDPIELPITAKVWDFAVPHKRNLPTEFSLRPHQLARFYFGQKAFYEFPKYLPAATYRRLLEYQLKYRIAPYPYCAGAGESASMVGYLGEKRNGETVVELDFTEYDKNTQLMLDYGVDMVCAGILFSPSQEYYKSFLPRMYEHLREKEWDKKAFVYGWDEFKPDKLAQVTQDYRWIKECAPTFKHLIPVNYAENLPEADDPGCMDIWVPTLAMYTRQFAAQRAKHGQSVWAYIVNSTEGSFDVHRPMDHYRSIFWNIWRRRCAGFLYYGTTFYHWAPGPADFNADGSPKKTFLSGSGSNMDFLCYPAGPKPEDGLNASVRLEAIRDGLEDWEYFNLLRNLLRDKKGETSAEINAAGRLMDAIDRGDATDAMLTLRRRVAEAIEGLGAGKR